MQRDIQTHHFSTDELPKALREIRSVLNGYDANKEILLLELHPGGSGWWHSALIIDNRDPDNKGSEGFAHKVLGKLARFIHLITGGKKDGIQENNNTLR